MKTGEVSIDFKKVVARKQEMGLSGEVVNRARLDKRDSLDLFRGQGRFTGPHEVEVNGDTLTSDVIHRYGHSRSRHPHLG